MPIFAGQQHTESLVSELRVDEFPCSAVGGDGVGCIVKNKEDWNSGNCLFSTAGTSEDLGKCADGTRLGIGMIKINGKMHKLKQKQCAPSHGGQVTYSGDDIRVLYSYKEINSPEPRGEEQEVAFYDASITISLGSKSRTLPKLKAACGD